MEPSVQRERKRRVSETSESEIRQIQHTPMFPLRTNEKYLLYIVFKGSVENRSVRGVASM